ncbi:MAG: bifunctional 4-hydroxy-2-oxoglutarate aldolase/2-dehydro-3-deoxy-phosphogluconate aldolase [Rhizobiaceae bacterium]
MENKQKIIHNIMTLAPVIPVVVVEEIGNAVALARALVAGGLPAIEVTLRTPIAMEALKVIADEVEGAFVGAGTVITAAQIREIEAAGAKFMVSPGVAANLLDAADDSALPLLPGTATASEVMALGERGYSHMKFFPGSLAGGAPYLKALSGPLPQYNFCPTGGVSLANASEYLALKNVLCVGGSWVAPKNLVEAGDWDAITKLASDATALK